MKHHHILSTVWLTMLVLLTFQCATDDTTPPQATEAHRPNFHFTPPAKWMNDPNGMVYLDGEYHLFYQHYPEDIIWGPMHWGHAVSNDLVNWEHLSVALKPDSLGYIFSGSAVFDQWNTSGFGTDLDPPLVAIYTYHDSEGEKAARNDFQYQGIAYSTDLGRTWTKYAGNPVLPNHNNKRDFRDPKVFWYDDYWVMVLAVQDRVEFYASKDLKQWRYLSEFGRTRGAHGGVWECPDLVPVQNQDTGARKWLLLVSVNPGAYNGGSGTQYFIGEFDGQRFRLDEEFGAHQARKARQDTTDNNGACWLDFGRDNYAGVTWSNLPDNIEDPIFMGWMSNWDYAQKVPTEKWRSAMTLPRQLRIKNTADGPRVFQRFADATQSKRGSVQTFAPSSDEMPFHLPLSPTALEIQLTVASGQAGQVGFELTNSLGEKYRIGYDATAQRYFSDRTEAGKIDFNDKFARAVHYAPKRMEGAITNMHLIIDRSSCEMLADDGMIALTDIFFPNEDFTEISLFCTDPSIEVQELVAYPW